MQCVESRVGATVRAFPIAEEGKLINELLLLLQHLLRAHPHGLRRQTWTRCRCWSRACPGPFPPPLAASSLFAPIKTQLHLINQGGFSTRR